MKECRPCRLMAMTRSQASILYEGYRAHPRPQVPVLMHFGRSDHAIPADDVQALRNAHPTVEVHEYDAGHAFNRDDDAPFQREAAALAWERSLAFFARHLR